MRFQLRFSSVSALLATISTEAGPAVGGAAATALVFGSLGAAGPASAATNTGNGQQQCNSLFWNLNSDQDTLHFWQLQRAQDAGHGLSTGLDDYEIDFYLNQIDQDIQALNDAGC